MEVKVEFGPRFAAEAGFAARDVELAPGARADALLAAIARAAPRLSCLDEGGASVDLGLANLSINGRSVDPRDPAAVALRQGDRAYLFSVIGGG